MDNTEQQDLARHEKRNATIVENGDVAQEWLHGNGSHIEAIEQKIEETNSAELPSRTMVVRRKNRIKEDGPWAMICEWGVEHQIGTIHLPPYFHTNSMLTLPNRTICQPSPTPGIDPPVLSESPPTNTQVLRTFLLQL